MKKKGYPHPKIKILKGLAVKKERGQTEAAAGLFFLLFLAVLLWALLQLELFQAAALYMEDALAASNLASAVIDVEEYGISGKLVIKDPWEAYDRYREALKINLNLDDAWNCPNRRMIAGQVRILKYIVYNCIEDTVYISYINEDGVLSGWQEALGQAVSPEGTVIESTGVYSEIAFPVEGLFGLRLQARKGKLADIVQNR